jgi:hypothetical protein
VRKLDTVFSKYIRARDGYCVVCGTSNQLQCGHLLSRIAYSTRWDEVNASAQCASCNIKHENNPAPYMLWFVKRFGEKKLEELNLQYNTPKKFSNNDLENMIEYYTKKLKDIENEQRICTI